MTTNKSRPPGDRRFPGRLYLLAMLILIGLPLLGLGVSLWLGAQKRTVNSAFTEPMRKSALPKDSTGVAAFSSDGTRFLDIRVDSEGGSPQESVCTLRLQNAETGECLQEMGGLKGIVAAAAFSPDGARCLVGVNQDSVVLWDLKTGKPIREIGGFDDIYNIAFSPDGRKCVVGGAFTAWICDVENGKLLHTLGGHQGPVFGVAFSPDGKQCLAGAFMEVKLWDVETGKLVREFGGIGGFVRAVAFSPDGRRCLAGSSSDNSLALWDVETDKRLWSSEKQTYISSIAFSPDGRWCLSADSGGMIQLRNAETGEEVGRFVRQGSGFSSVAFAEKGRFIRSTGWRGLEGRDPFQPFEGSNEESARGPELLYWRIPTDEQLWAWRLMGGELPEPPRDEEPTPTP